jgi:hypothetical protein
MHDKYHDSDDDVMALLALLAGWLLHAWTLRRTSARAGYVQAYSQQRAGGRGHQCAANVRQYYPN